MRKPAGPGRGQHRAESRQNIQQMTEEGAHRPGSWNGGAPIQTVRRQQTNEMERSHNLFLDLREHRLAETLGFHSDPNCRTATTACAAACRKLGIPPPQRIAHGISAAPALGESIARSTIMLELTVRDRVRSLGRTV